MTLHHCDADASASAWRERLPTLRSVMQDEHATMALWGAAARGGKLQIASAYLNLPPG